MEEIPIKIVKKKSEFYFPTFMRNIFAINRQIKIKIEIDKFYIAFKIKWL